MNISIIGSRGLSAKLAKKGTSSDITLYNTSFQGKYFTFVEPETYPEKIQTLFQAINMSQFSILYVTQDIQRNVLGECIIALDMLKKPGLIVLDSFPEDELKQFVKETHLKNFQILANNSAEIMPAISAFNALKAEGSPKVLVDHSFDVKSVGTVVLGTVTSGEIKKHDNLKAYPSGKSVSIRSIQIHDKDFEKAECYDRVGLSIKGGDVSDFSRGTIIAQAMDCAKEANIILDKNKFFRDELPKNVMAVAGLQYSSAVMEGGKLVFGKEIALDSSEIIILAPDKKMRIVGAAKTSKG
ncbi:MAG: hypothetical protein HYV78_02350 [Candidatus Wildermuthbacteria bacterium]|nr:hypothetical protein [Candidatus Wildermuthbacteria bacterium]